ncbi:MAG: hypothetical protein ACOC6Q_00390 [Patescibacteria group bacterium]
MATAERERNRVSGQALAQKILDTISIITLWFLTVITAFVCYYLAESFWRDLILSVNPLIAIGVSSVVAWTLSLLSTVSELQLWFVNREMLSLVKKRAPQEILPFTNVLKFKALRILNLTMVGYDIGTNLVGSWMESNPSLSLQARLLATAVDTAVITFSEDLLVIFFAFFLSFLTISVRITLELMENDQKKAVAA